MKEQEGEAGEDVKQHQGSSALYKACVLSQQLEFLLPSGRWYNSHCCIHLWAIKVLLLNAPGLFLSFTSSPEAHVSTPAEGQLRW